MCVLRSLTMLALRWQGLQSLAPPKSHRASLQEKDNQTTWAQQSEHSVNFLQLPSRPHNFRPKTFTWQLFCEHVVRDWKASRIHRCGWKLTVKLLLGCVCIQVSSSIVDTHVNQHSCQLWNSHCAEWSDDERYSCKNDNLQETQVLNKTCKSVDPGPYNSFFRFVRKYLDFASQWVDMLIVSNFKSKVAILSFRVEISEILSEEFLRSHLHIFLPWQGSSISILWHQSSWVLLFQHRLETVRLWQAYNLYAANLPFPYAWWPDWQIRSDNTYRGSTVGFPVEPNSWNIDVWIT